MLVKYSRFVLRPPEGLEGNMYVMYLLFSIAWSFGSTDLIPRPKRHGPIFSSKVCPTEGMTGPDPST